MTKLCLWSNSKKQLLVSFIGCSTPEGFRREVSDHSAPEDYEALVELSRLVDSFYIAYSPRPGRTVCLSRPFSACYYDKSLDTFYLYPLSFSRAFHRWRLNNAPAQTSCISQERTTC